MSSRPKRLVLIVAGSVLVAIGTIGVFLPLLPTTPFLLLAAMCYAQSSRRLYGALLRNRVLGSYITDYLERGGMTRRAKVWTLTLLWIGIIATAVFATESPVVRLILALIVAGVTLHILKVAAPRELGEKSDSPVEPG